MPRKDCFIEWVEEFRARHEIREEQGHFNGGIDGGRKRLLGTEGKPDHLSKGKELSRGAEDASW